MIWRWTRRLLLGLLSLAMIAGTYVLIAYRDLPVDELERRYYPDQSPLTANISGVDLRYQVQGTGPPVLLIHSHFFSMRMWDPWVELLAARFTLIRFDLTSHGLTGPDPSGDYHMDRSIELIVGLLDYLTLDRVHVVGSSLGGNMAFRLAADHPDRVDRLVLVNSGGMRRSNSRAGGEIPDWVDPLFYLMPRFLYARFLRWMIYDDSQVDDDLIAEFHDMFRRDGNRPAEMDRLRAFQVEDPTPVLARIRAPTLILWGRDNPQLPHELAEQFRSHLTGATAEVHIIPNAGHVLPLERPQPSAGAAAEFFEREGGP